MPHKGPGFSDNKTVSVERRGKRPVLLPLTLAPDAVRWRQSATVRCRSWSSRRSLVSCRRLRGCHRLHSPRTPAQTARPRALTGASDMTVATAASTPNCSTQSSMATYLKSPSKYISAKPLYAWTSYLVLAYFYFLSLTWLRNLNSSDLKANYSTRYNDTVFLILCRYIYFRGCSVMLKSAEFFMVHFLMAIHYPKW